MRLSKIPRSPFWDIHRDSTANWAGTTKDADGSVLVLERPADAFSDLRSLTRTVPSSRSLVDELLEERRVAAADE